MGRNTLRGETRAAARIATLVIIGVMVAYAAGLTAGATARMLWIFAFGPENSEVIGVAMFALVGGGAVLAYAGTLGDEGVD